jgi:H+/gluconate symporter-like permease
MGLLGILVGLAMLVLFAFRGWSVLLLAPAAALVAAAFGREPLLANWTQVFMGSAARFLAQFFPIFLLGAVFGKLMDDSDSVSAVADFMTKTLGERRAILAVVLAGAFVTYGGVSLFVAFFVLSPMAQALFRAAAVPRRLMPAAIVLGTSTFTMSALPGTPSIQNAMFRHDAICGARPRYHCGGDHAWFWLVVAQARRGCGSPRWRGLWSRSIG